MAKNHGQKIAETGSPGARVDELIAYCHAEDRVCPQPASWNEFWTILGAPHGILAAPLILAGWVYSTDEEKRLRLAEHIHFAERHGSLDRASAFLRLLPDSEWHHLMPFRDSMVS